MISLIPTTAAPAASGRATATGARATGDAFAAKLQKAVNARQPAAQPNDDRMPADDTIANEPNEPTADAEATVGDGTAKAEHAPHGDSDASTSTANTGAASVITSPPAVVTTISPSSTPAAVAAPPSSAPVVTTPASPSGATATAVDSPGPPAAPPSESSIPAATPALPPVASGEPVTGSAAPPSGAPTATPSISSGVAASSPSSVPAGATAQPSAVEAPATADPAVAATPVTGQPKPVANGDAAPTKSTDTSAPPAPTGGPVVDSAVLAKGALAGDTDTGDDSKQRRGGSARGTEVAASGHLVGPAEVVVTGNVATRAGDRVGTVTVTAEPVATTTHADHQAVARAADVLTTGEHAGPMTTNRLSLEMDGNSRVAVRMDDTGHFVRVDVLADPTGRLDGAWRADMSDSLRNHGLELDQRGADNKGEGHHREDKPDDRSATDGGLPRKLLRSRTTRPGSLWL